MVVSSHLPEPACQSFTVSQPTGKPVSKHAVLVTIEINSVSRFSCQHTASMRQEHFLEALLFPSVRPSLKLWELM